MSESVYRPLHSKAVPYLYLSESAALHVYGLHRLSRGSQVLDDECQTV